MGADENTKMILDTLGEHRKEQREENKLLHKRVTDESDKLRDTMIIHGERIAKVETRLDEHITPESEGGNAKIWVAAIGTIGTIGAAIAAFAFAGGS